MPLSELPNVAGPLQQRPALGRVGRRAEGLDPTGPGSGTTTTKDPMSHESPPPAPPVRTTWAISPRPARQRWGRSLAEQQEKEVQRACLQPKKRRNPRQSPRPPSP